GNFSKAWIVYLIIAAIGVLYYSYFLSSETKLYIEESIVPYAFEMFINLMEGGKLETNSSNVLKQMYFPIDANSFLWGESYYFDPVKGGFYRNTDAGYMRQILFYGIFGSLLLYLFYYILVKKI